MKCLITYHCHCYSGDRPGGIGHTIADSSEDFIEEYHQYQDETYYILNVLEISDEKAEEWQSKSIVI